MALREAETEECALSLAKEADVAGREAHRRAKEDSKRQAAELKLAWDRQREEQRDREQKQRELEKDEAVDGKAVTIL